MQREGACGEQRLRCPSSLGFLTDFSAPVVSLLCACVYRDEAKAMPKELFVKCANAGWLAGVVGPPWQAEFAGDKLAGGVKPQEFDAFHEQIIIEEVCRAGSGGVVWGLFAGLSIGLPPVLHFGNKAQQVMVCGPCLRGEKVICLAITEPSAGSDVANLKTTAVKTADGKHYVRKTASTNCVSSPPLSSFWLPHPLAEHTLGASEASFCCAHVGAGGGEP